MAHFYQRSEIQDIADYVGDSLALAQWAASTNANIIVLCGVNLWEKRLKFFLLIKVFIPDMEAGCSLADSCKAVDFMILSKTSKSYSYFFMLIQQQK